MVGGRPTGVDGAQTMTPSNNSRRHTVLAVSYHGRDFYLRRHRQNP